ncbi:hypothetical protein [Muricomes intestini]|uniref:hypothetical protein n=1 Tax=Muricomes intestini TaxID=1796634 RepID=UPI002682143C
MPGGHSSRMHKKDAQAAVTRGREVLDRAAQDHMVKGHEERAAGQDEEDVI